MKLLVTSDWHADWTTRGVSRFQEVREAVIRSIREAIEEDVDAYVFLGDLCDPDSGPPVFRSVALLIEAAVRLTGAGIPSIWLAGNHDVIEDGTGDTTLTPLRPFGNGLVHVMEQPGVVHRREQPPIVCLPFTASSHGYDTEETAHRLVDPQRADTIVISHLTVPGIVPGEETTEMPRGREVLYPFEATKRAACRLQGHYHRRQAFDPGDGSAPIQVPGSLARLTFAEEDNAPCFLVVRTP